MEGTKQLFINRAIIIQKPLKEVFYYLASMENMHELMINVVGMEKQFLGEVAIGSKWIESRHLRGHIVKAEVECTQYEENNKFAIKSNSSGLLTEYVYTFDQVEEGTQVVMKGFITLTTLRMKLFKRYLKRTITKEDGYQLYYLKEMLENPPVEEQIEDKEQERIELLEELLTTKK